MKKENFYEKNLINIMTKSFTLFLLVFWFVVFILFIFNVSIGSMIGNDCCNGNMQEQFWNIGIFIAIIAGFMCFSELSLSLFYKEWGLEKVENEKPRKF